MRDTTFTSPVTNAAEELAIKIIGTALPIDLCANATYRCRCLAGPISAIDRPQRRRRGGGRVAADVHAGLVQHLERRVRLAHVLRGRFAQPRDGLAHVARDAGGRRALRETLPERALCDGRNERSESWDVEKEEKE